MSTRTQNSSINLNVSNTGDGFLLQGGQSGWNFTITSGDINLYGGATILNGQLLVGSAADNAFEQGNLFAGSGIGILSGANALTVSLSGNNTGAPPVGTSTLVTLSNETLYGNTSALLGAPSGWLYIPVGANIAKIPFYY